MTSSTGRALSTNVVTSHTDACVRRKCPKNASRQSSFCRTALANASLLGRLQLLPEILVDSERADLRIPTAQGEVTVLFLQEFKSLQRAPMVVVGGSRSGLSVAPQEHALLGG